MTLSRFLYGLSMLTGKRPGNITPQDIARARMETTAIDILSKSYGRGRVVATNPSVPHGSVYDILGQKVIQCGCRPAMPPMNIASYSMVSCANCGTMYGMGKLFVVAHREMVT